MEIRGRPLSQILDWAGEIQKDPRHGWEAVGVLNYQEPDEGIAALDDGNIVGAATMAPGRVVGVYVHFDHRGKGLGAALMTAAVNRLLAKGYSTIIAEVCDSRSFGMIEKLPQHLKDCLDVLDVRRD